MKNLKLLLCAFMLGQSFLAFAQESDTVDVVTNRLFMPSIQMGYINQLSDELAGGLLIQTSLEYRIPNQVFIRLNYDDFDADFEIVDPLDIPGTVSGKVSFSELLLGVGYRIKKNNSNFVFIAQPGLRFYGFPLIVNSDNNNISIDIENRAALVGRYTFGYEYEVFPMAFLVLELFTSSAWESADYWSENRWAWGFSLGIATTIF